MTPLSSEKTSAAENISTAGTKEIKLDDGETLTFPTIEVGKMQLFHGSSVAGIKEFTAAEETTLGEGVYLTSSYDAAAGYALVRSEYKQNPHVYEAEIENSTLLDLTTKESLDSLAKLLRQELWKRRRRNEELNLTDIQKYVFQNVFTRLIEKIDQKTYKYPRDLLFNLHNWSTEMLTPLGFDGIKALEGGESSSTITIGNHDSFVIFDPGKAKIVEEVQIASHLPEESPK